MGHRVHGSRSGRRQHPGTMRMASWWHRWSAGTMPIPQAREARRPRYIFRAVAHARQLRGAQTMKMIPLLPKEGSGVVDPAVTLAPTTPAPPPAEEGRRFQGGLRKNVPLAFTLHPLHFNLLKLAAKFFSKEQTIETARPPLLCLGFLAMRILPDADGRPCPISRFVAASSRAISIPHDRKRPYRCSLAVAVVGSHVRGSQHVSLRARSHERISGFHFHREFRPIL